MPLKPATDSRKKIHTRDIRCEAFQREDGLWDIEGHMTDVKSYSFANRDRGGKIKAGEPLHGMWLRITVDESYLIHAAEAVTDYSPFNVCPEIASNYAKLVGLKIAAGWRKEVHLRVGGVEGCTHLSDLLAPMATTAMQAMNSGSRKDKKDKKPVEDPSIKAAKQAKIINRCYALSESGEVAKEFFPENYKPAKEE